LLEEPANQVGSDEAAAAGYQYSLGNVL